MLTDNEVRQCKWHFSPAFCQTKRGCKRHLEVISMDDLRLLCRFLNCSVDELLDCFWKKRIKPDMTVPSMPLFRKNME